jgi:glutaminyl-peptide cyclotransferase
MNRSRKNILAAFACVSILFTFPACVSITTPTAPLKFDGARAYSDVEYQVGLGPRTPDSQAHARVVDWIQQEISQSGWDVQVQTGTEMDHPYQNIIAKRGTGTPWFIIGAHYDSRLWANQDQDPQKQKQPVAGANDGASGVAVLLELGRVLPKDLKGQIWLAFFDAEDQGNIPGWDWTLGSRAMADSLSKKPDGVIVIDMIGDKNLDIYMERNSSKELTQQIWDSAANLGYQNLFIPKYKFSMEDDHTPFLQKGIPAVDIIDFDYPYWHTTGDTADKVSAASLQTVGDTLYNWLTSR